MCLPEGDFIGPEPSLETQRSKSTSPGLSVVVGNEKRQGDLSTNTRSCMNSPQVEPEVEEYIGIKYFGIKHNGSCILRDYDMLDLRRYYVI